MKDKERLSPGREEELSSLTKQAVDRFFQYHADALDVAFKSRLMSYFGISPAIMVERSDEKRNLENRFMKPASQVSAEVARANTTPGLLKMLVASYLGDEFLGNIFKLSAIHQLAETSLTAEERILAEKLAISRIDLDEINVGNEIGVYLEKELTKIGGRMVQAFKGQNYRELINSQQNTTIINISRSDFYALAAYLTGVGKNALNFDLFTPMFNNNGITLRVDNSGSVYLDWGMETRLVAQNLRDLVIDVEIPDPIEAANAVISGNFSFKWFQSLTRAVAGKTKNGKSKVVDAGVLTISLAGKNETIVLPVPSVGRGMSSIKRFIRTLKAVQQEVTQPQMEEGDNRKIPWSMLEDSDLREAIEEEVTEVAGNIPRFTRVIEEAKRLRKENSSARINNEWRLIDRVRGADSDDRLNWFNDKFSLVAEEVGELLRQNPRIFIDKENEVKIILAKSGVSKDDLIRGYRIVRTMAENILRNQQKIRWLKSKHEIEIGYLVNSENLERWRPLFDSKTSDYEKRRIIEQINGYLLKRGISVFEIDEVREVIVNYARMFF